MGDMEVIREYKCASCGANLRHTLFGLSMSVGGHVAGSGVCPKCKAPFKYIVRLEYDVRPINPEEDDDNE